MNRDSKTSNPQRSDQGTSLTSPSGKVFWDFALYGHALLDAPSDQRCLFALGKTKGAVRAAAVAHLESLQWHRGLDVALDRDLIQRARDGEDDFDAYLSALGILRLLLENVSLEDDSLRSRRREPGGPLLDSIAEGGMLGVLATQLKLGQRAFVAPRPTDTPDSPAPGCGNPRAGHARSRPGGAWVRVTRRSIENTARHPNNRQISFSGLPSGAKNTPAWVEIECQGRPYTLTIKDTTACWSRHQVQTAEDFDALFELLSRNPDEHFPVELVGDCLPAGESRAESGEV